jgi:hypothetical protein
MWWAASKHTSWPAVHKREANSARSAKACAQYAIWCSTLATAACGTMRCTCSCAPGPAGCGAWACRWQSRPRTPFGTRRAPRGQRPFWVGFGLGSIGLAGGGQVGIRQREAFQHSTPTRSRIKPTPQPPNETRPRFNPPSSQTPLKSPPRTKSPSKKNAAAKPTSRIWCSGGSVSPCARSSSVTIRATASAAAMNCSSRSRVHREIMVPRAGGWVGGWGGAGVGRLVLGRESEEDERE